MTYTTAAATLANTPAAENVADFSLLLDIPAAAIASSEALTRKAARAVKAYKSAANYFGGTVYHNAPAAKRTAAAAKALAKLSKLPAIFNQIEALCTEIDPANYTEYVAHHVAEARDLAQKAAAELTAAAA